MGDAAGLVGFTNLKLREAKDGGGFLGGAILDRKKDRPRMAVVVVVDRATRGSATHGPLF
jgi:hypothetical protein